MNNRVLIAVIAIAIFGSGFGLGIWFDKAQRPAVRPAPVAYDSTTRPPMTHPGSMPTQAEWQALRETRDKTLQNDPALQAEYHGLLDQITAQEQQVQAAMIKADPKVAPLLAKLAAIRRPQIAPQAPVTAKPANAQ